MSGSHREVRDIVKTVVCSKVHFINSCSIFRLAVLPFTEETIDDISLGTRLIVPLLFLSLFPSPTPPLLRLPFLLALFFPVFAFPFFCTWLLSLFFFVFSSLCFFQLQVLQEGSANLFNVLVETFLQLLNPKREPLHESHWTEVVHHTRKHQEIWLWSNKKHLYHRTKPHPEKQYIFQFPLPQGNHLYSCRQCAKQPF